MAFELSLPAKVGAGASAAAAGSLAIAGGAGAFSSGAVNSSNTNTELEGLKAKNLKGSIEKHFSYFLHPVLGENAEGTWNTIFTRFVRKKENLNSLSPVFRKVEIPFSEEENERSLNWACKKSYQSTLEDIEAVEDGNALDWTKIKLKHNIWEFCSNLHNSPATFLEIFTFSRPQEELNDKHVSVKYKRELLADEQYINDVYWSRKNEVFFSINEKEITGLYFKALRKDEEKKKNNLSLKDACMSFYKQELNNTTDSATQPKLDSFLNYCSWYTLY